MAKSLHNLNNFSGGEVSPKLDARVDQPKYATWMRQCQNMIPFKSGGLTRRPGTQYIAQAKLANVPGPNGTYLHNYAVAIYPFVFSPNVTFELEVGNGYIRFYSQGQQVSLVTANLPLWITTAAYTAGQFVNFSGNAYYCIASISGTPFPGNVTPDVDTTHWVQQNVLEVPTPYIADCGTAAPTYQGFNYAGIQSFDTDPYILTLTQINDLVYFVHPLYPPYVLTRFSNTNWTFTQVPFLTPALLDQNATDVQIAASAVTGTGITLTTSAPAWSAATYYTLANSVSFTWSVAAGGAGSSANPMLSGSTYIISTSGTVNWTALGAAATTVGTQFVYNGVTATGSGGQCQAIYNCVTPNQSSASFLGDVNAGYWQQYLNFNSLHVGSTWQLAYLNPSSYLEVDGTAASGFTNATSGSIQCIGQWEVHTYGVWSSDIAIQRSTDGGNTWQTIRTVQSRSDRNVDITGTAVQLGLYRFVVSNSAALVNAGATNPRIVFEIVDAFLYGLVNITAVTNNFTATANVVTQLASTSATEFWSEAAWSNYRGFPQAVASFQQRIIYGGSGYEPQRIWGTVTNDIQNFSLGDQTLATDSFAFDLNAPMRGPIQWLLGQTDLICGFSGAEWIINSGSTNNQGASSGAAIGPTNINAVEHSTWGTAELVQPIIVGDAVLYAQRQSTTVRQMMFSFYTAKYMSQDLTMLAEHLFSSGIVQMAFMTRWRRQSIIWTVTRAGTLCGMTYELDQEVFGWHRHVTGFGQTDLSGNVLTNDNGFESVCCNFGQGTAEDEVWVVANRNINGVQTRFIERMNPNVWEEAFTGAPMTPAPNLAQAFYVDCGSTITMPGSTTIGGLYYLNNRYVIGLADGNAFGPLQVVNGSVTLPASIPASVGTVNIGLPISYAGQPMRIDVDQRLGATQGLVKQVSDIYLRVWNANGGSVSNGTSLPANWISGTAYPIGTTVTSPASLQTFYCVVPTSGGALTLDPSANVYAWNGGAPTGNWVLTFTPSYMKPTPIPYPSNTNIPYVSPMFVTVPTDIRLLPMPMPSPGADPVVVVQGSDALPLTVLGIFYKYDLTGTA